MADLTKTRAESFISANDKNYAEFLNTVKAHIRDARIRTSRAASRELIYLYWQIGEDIVARQERLGWGKSVVVQLAKDLKTEFPGTSGFSSANLWLMRQFYSEYRQHTKLAQLARDKTFRRRKSNRLTKPSDGGNPID